jgi:hypothetical protein
MTAGEIIDVQSKIISMQAKVIQSLYETLAQHLTAEEMDGMPETRTVNEIAEMQKQHSKW